MYDHLPEDMVYACMQMLRADVVVVDFLSCDSTCLNGKGLAHIARTARQDVIAEYHHSTQATAVNPVIPLSANDLAGLDTNAQPVKDQFCFLATEQPLRRFQPLFQNQRFLVLQM